MPRLVYIHSVLMFSDFQRLFGALMNLNAHNAAIYDHRRYVTSRRYL